MDPRGIHHVTMIAGDAQANVDFYAGRLGLRLVKRTVNFDDPLTYHLYYGDANGSPGSILTFFPYKRARKGTRGRGQANLVTLAVPPGSLSWWRDRLGDVRVEDPDGLAVELAESDMTLGEPWTGGGVPAEHAIRGVKSVELWVGEAGPTRRVLEALGVGEEVVHIREVGNAPAGVGGAGTVHHVAFRVGDDAGEAAMRAKVIGLGLRPTGVIDRQYFRSVYFREPGGVLFELATDPPGFAADEPADSLGTSLKLPPQYGPQREEIERGLDPLLPPRGDGPIFAHRWKAGGNGRTLLMLHGTGGDEFDLLPLASKLDPAANVLSPRGRVDERGSPRFFRRVAEGVFDEPSVRGEATALADWLATTADRRGFDAAAVDAVGYSNGANVASAALLLRPGFARSLALLRPMVPLREPPDADLSGTRVLLLGGRRDPIAPPAEVAALRGLLASRGAAVAVHEADAGHELTGADLDAAAGFLRAG